MVQQVEGADRADRGARERADGQRKNSGEKNKKIHREENGEQHQSPHVSQGHAAHQVGMEGSELRDANESVHQPVDATAGMPQGAAQGVEGAADDKGSSNDSREKAGEDGPAASAGSAAGIRNGVQNRRHLQTEKRDGVSVGTRWGNVGPVGSVESKSNGRGTRGPSADRGRSGAAASAVETPPVDSTSDTGTGDQAVQANQSLESVSQAMATTKSDSRGSRSLHSAFAQEGKGGRAVESGSGWQASAAGGASSHETQVRGSSSRVRSGSSSGSGGSQTQQQQQQQLAPSNAQGSATGGVKQQAESVDELDQDTFLQTIVNNQTQARPFLHRKKAVLPTEHQLRTLFLHSKRVAPMNMQALNKFLCPTAQKRLSELMQGLHYDRDKHAESEPPPSKFRIPAKHATILTEDRNDGKGRVLELEGNIHDKGFDISAYQLMSYFCVVEAKNSGLEGDTNDHRLRCIMWARKHLQQSNYASDLRLDDTYEHRQYVHEGEYAAAYDLAASFWQVPLPKQCKFVVVDDEGNVYRMTRLPYGVDSASEIMQIIVSAIAGVPSFASAMHAMPASKGHPHVHIDGALYVNGSHALVNDWREKITAACRATNIQLNVEDSNVVSTSLRFVGIDYDFTHKRVRIKPSFKVPPVSRQMIASDFERLMGKLIYGGTVLGVGFHHHLFAVKYYRRIANALAAGRMHRHDVVVLAPAVMRHLLTWHRIVVENQWVSVAQSPWLQPDDVPHAVLITDSTLDGFGCVLLREGHEPLAFGQRWPARRDDVNDAETHAIVIGLDRFQQEFGEILRLPGSGPRLRLLILVDNTSALHRVVRAERGFQLQPNHFALGVLQRIHDRHIDARIEYVSSPLNVADAPSRGRMIDEKLVRYTLERAWGQRGVRAQRSSHTCVGAAARRPTRT